MTSCAAWDEGHIKNTGRDTEEEASPQFLPALCLLVSYWIVTQHSPLDTIGFGHRWTPSSQITMGNQSLFCWTRRVFHQPVVRIIANGTFCSLLISIKPLRKKRKDYSAKPEPTSSKQFNGNYSIQGSLNILTLKKKEIQTHGTQSLHSSTYQSATECFYTFGFVPNQNRDQ